MGPRRLVARATGRIALLTIGVAMLVTGTASAAVEQPFVTRFAANDRGEIAIAGNTLMTCPVLPDCANAQQGLGAGSLNNNGWDMVRVDTDGDPSTFDSSAATVTLPPGATVLFAGLYYGSRTSAGTNGVAAPNAAARGTVRLRTPASPAYATVTAAVADSAQVANAYVGFADVTAAVAAGGSGQYAVADVQSGTGVDRYAGWALVIAYRDAAQPARNLTVFDGLASIAQTDPPLSFTVGGFLTPLEGAVRSTVGVVAYEGDRGSSGDRLLLDGQLLSDSANPQTNVFNSSIADRGMSLAGRDPGYVNQFGFDADLIGADGILPNGATSAVLEESTTLEQYLTQVVTVSTELYPALLEPPPPPPPVADLKATTEVSPNAPREGEDATYTIEVRNDGPDAAPNVVVTDAVEGAEILAADPSQGTCVVAETVRCELGTIAPGATATVRVRVRPTSRGTLVNRAGVTSSAADPTPIAALPVLRTRVVEGRARLTVRKRVNVRRATTGQLVGYRITVRSTGRAPARRVRVCDLPPAGLALVSLGGTRVRAGGACWPIATLAVGASRTLRVQARVTAHGGRLRNAARVIARNARARADTAPIQVSPVGPEPCARPASGRARAAC